MLLVFNPASFRAANAGVIDPETTRVLHVSASEAGNGRLLVVNPDSVGAACSDVIDADTSMVLHSPASEADGGILLVLNPESFETSAPTGTFGHQTGCVPSGVGFMISETTEPSLDISSPAKHIKSFPQASRANMVVDPMPVSNTPFIQFPWYDPEALKGLPPGKLPPLTVRSTTKSFGEP